MKKVGIIGHFGGKENFSDGQTVKTKVIFEELKKISGFKLYTADTYYIKKNPLNLLWQTIQCVANCKDVFVLLSKK